MKLPAEKENQTQRNSFDSDNESPKGLSMAPPPFQLKASSANPVQRTESKEKESFDPKLGTGKTEFKGNFGDFTVNHGLTKKPSGGYGEYSYKLEMKPNEKAGASKIGFIQTVRQGKADGTAATKPGEMFLTKGETDRQESEDGWMIDRANPTRDKTPFYGMVKNDKGKIEQYSTSQVGEYKGKDAMMSDTPAVADPDHMRFVSTATDMKDGTQMGSVEWGYEYNSAAKKYVEVKPSLLKDGDDKLKARDRAYKKWDEVVANDEIDKVPSK